MQVNYELVFVPILNSAFKCAFTHLNYSFYRSIIECYKITDKTNFTFSSIDEKVSPIFPSSSLVVYLLLLPGPWRSLLPSLRSCTQLFRAIARILPTLALPQPIVEYPVYVTSRRILFFLIPLKLLNNVYLSEDSLDQYHFQIVCLLNGRFTVAQANHALRQNRESSSLRSTRGGEQPFVLQKRSSRKGAFSEIMRS